MAESSNSSDLIPVPHRPKHSHGMSIIYTDLLPEERLFWDNYSTETFFTTQSSHRGALYTHIASYVGSFFFVFPFVLVFWNTHHALFLPALTVHTALVVVSSFNFWVFSSSVRDGLYPHSAFSTMTVLLFVGSLVHWLIALFALGYRALNSDIEYKYAELESDEESLSLNSPSLTLRGSSVRFDSFELEDFDRFPRDGHLQTSNDSMIRLSPSRLSHVLNRFPLLNRATHVFGKVALSTTGLMNWALFAFFLVYFPTGIATYLLYGQDEFKFNLLAHFIKGGVFFVLGLVTLARYCGAFKNKGWAWNHRFVTAAKASSGWLKWQSKGLWTMEMIESSLILFYGSTNIFMEHMASPDGKWTAKDLQHVSIAFIYLGCGLCGVLLEKILADWRFSKSLDNASLVVESKKLSTVQKATPGFSPNPFPALTIYWTGVLMSLHEQASSLSSEIHKQWGNMFVLGCAFRVVSYLYFLLKPLDGKALTKPAHPITEVLVSFCLLSGGMIFMESCDSVVYLLEYYGLTSMFTLNICLGIAALIMAWVMAVFYIKDAFVSRMSHHRSSV
ncbi:hypothetical protein METBIDRAFT_46518 [Metschnikowia bicuspidata var. bicuspidata NRRL YB-4993]|uniref:Protein YTP1-like C-terminal domain-containing protein n=1 Tax=Metschnikowia bicuspidata var. bicuspidata NRRL YB-4993 TaxID=869754 RepID=A0A1A0H5Q2_9ASCO|nr:hypothetical protein METBIDRAFT_46518 [Metschnikowia bicuspidata var. bicuspidata NRRL YB-4993]OBA19243.1 hypothetical protein METBIDRAFT_46518 [Metschnikowia bicuspidata var. bicuspidata NRRL YB-4993]